MVSSPRREDVVPDDLQLLLFENEEYLTPRELKECYGLRLRRGLYDLHGWIRSPGC
jgi:hypothetical protein